MRQIILTDEAYKDLEHIFFEGLINFGKLQAFKYQNSFHRIFELLADMPGLGRKVNADAITNTVLFMEDMLFITRLSLKKLS